jgi:hypothetical protein
MKTLHKRCAGLDVTPLEIVPWPKVFDTVLLLDPSRRVQRSVPDIALNGTAIVIFDREGFF